MLYVLAAIAGLLLIYAPRVFLGLVAVGGILAFVFVIGLGMLTHSIP